MSCSLGGMEEIKGEGNEFQSDGAENRHQYGLNLDVFEVQIMRFLIKNALWLYAELCLLPERREYFQKSHEKSDRKYKHGARRG